MTAYKKVLLVVMETSGQCQGALIPGLIPTAAATQVACSYSVQQDKYRYIPHVSLHTSNYLPLTSLYWLIDCS